MNSIEKRLQNFWFYYKKHLLIGLAAVLVVCYLSGMNNSAPTQDYHIGLVQPVPCTEETLLDLEARFAACGEDINGDGTVLVQIHTYFLDFEDEAPDAGVRNAETVARLDADLVGKTSGIFLLHDEEGFRNVTGDILSDTSVPFDNGLHLVLRRDADDTYLRLADKIS